jgi:hypothetical protein
MRAKPFSNANGYSTIQLVITLAVASIITGFAIVGITRARDHVRLMNSAREFAAYVERARSDAVRRHNTATVQTISEGRYRVVMDFDGNGSIDAADTKTFNLQPGVRFTTGIKGVTFDWRGRIPGEQSFGFSNGRNTVSVGITGSGDVTFDAQFFSDSLLPAVTYTGTPGGFIPDPGASPTPTAYPTATPTPSPTPTPDPNASPTPTPTPTAYPTPTPTPTPTAYPTPTPTPTATANPTPTPAPCTLDASPSPLNVVSDGSGTISVNRTSASGQGTITAASSNNGQIQVSPGSQTVSGTSAASFTVTVKKSSGSVTFSSSGCTGKTVSINVQ